MDILSHRPNLLFTIAIRRRYPEEDDNYGNSNGILYRKFIRIIKKLSSNIYYKKIVLALTTVDIYLENDEGCPFWDGFYNNGDVVWRVNHFKHRDDGPAVLNCVDPTHVQWWLCGKRHTEDGSIYEYPKKKIERIAPWANFYKH